MFGKKPEPAPVVQRWKRPEKVKTWLRRADTRWGTPVRVFVRGKLMAVIES